MELLAYCLIWTASLMWVVENIPQICKILKTKNVSGISKGYFWICLIAYVLYIVGNCMLQNWIIALSHIPSFLMLIIILILVNKYEK